MTIIIGIICKDGILVGSDSRTTFPDYSVRDNAKKIRFIQLENATYAIAAHSGDDDLGTRVMDRIESLAKPVIVNDWQSVSDVGNKAIAEEIKKLRNPYEGPDFKMENFKNIWMGFDSSFMITHFFNGCPYIFTADFYPGIFSRRNQSTYSIGCGSPLANFLLNAFDFSNLSISEAAPALVYVIEEVKKFDPRCGSPTKIVYSQINKFVKATIEGKPEIPPQPLIQNGYLHDEAINNYIAEIDELRTTIKSEWSKKMQAIVIKAIQMDLKRRTAPERFIRMRHGTPLVEAAKQESNKIGNKDLRKLISDFSWGQANGMEKTEMERLWKEICFLIPSKPDLVEMGENYFKMF